MPERTAKDPDGAELDLPNDVGHIVFDWNGTLFHDAPVIAMCDAAVGRHRGLWDIDIDEGLLREYSQRHWRAGYESLAGRPLTGAEVEGIGDLFHDFCVEYRDHAVLQPDALTVLDALDARGVTMSINSMHPHGLLLDVLVERGIAERFVVVEGLEVDDHGALGKTGHLATHLESVSAVLGQPVEELRRRSLMIGDTVDDATAARDNGIPAVIVTTGTTSEARIVASGFPYRSSLTAALTAVIG